MDLQADVVVTLDIRLGEAWSVALFYRQDKLVFIIFESISESSITVGMHCFSSVVAPKVKWPHWLTIFASLGPSDI